MINGTNRLIIMAVLKILLVVALFAAAPDASADITNELIGNWKRSIPSVEDPKTRDYGKVSIRKLGDGRVYIFSEINLEGQKIKDVQIWLKSNGSARSVNEIIHVVDDVPSHRTGHKLSGNGRWWQKKKTLHFSLELYNSEDKKKYFQTIIFKKLNRNKFSINFSMKGFGSFIGTLSRVKQ